MEGRGHLATITVGRVWAGGYAWHWSVSDGRNVASGSAKTEEEAWSHATQARAAMARSETIRRNQLGET